MPTRIFVNLPVADLRKSRAFFETLGFAFNVEFTGENAACMIVAEGSHVMLLTREFFQTFTRKKVADAASTTEVLTCLALDSKAQVNDMVGRAIAAGATEVRPAQDHGFMFGRSFNDLDGHIWEIIWMDPDASKVGTRKMPAPR
ncbi:MAG: VOC family protein [Hyphomicrobium sp.]